MTLRQMINRITEKSLPGSIRKKSFIVNDTAKEIQLKVDGNKVASLLSNAIYMVINNTQDSCIRISAKVFENEVVVSIRDNGLSEKNSILQGIDQLQMLAQRMGGWIGLSEYGNKIKTIDLGFPNVNTTIAA